MRIIASCLCVLVGLCAVNNADEPAAKWKQVQARTLELRVPENWQEKKSTSSMRAAQFVIPGDPEDAELVVFYFGGPTGGVKANVQRWIGQFKEDGLELKMHEGKCKAGRYILVDTTGTWKKPVGPPFARQTVEAPHSRVLNVILMEEKTVRKIITSSSCPATKTLSAS